MVCALRDSRQRNGVVVANVLGVAALLVFRPGQAEEWREAAVVVADSQRPVALCSRLIEAEHEHLRNSPSYQEYLRAPLTVYGVQQPITVVAVSQSD